MSRTIKTKPAAIGAPRIKCVNFGVVDEKGREIDVHLVQRDISYVTLPRDAMAWHNHPPGDFVEVTIWSSRNSEPYGEALDGETVAPGKADAFITNKIANIRKRYLKTFKRTIP